MTSMLQLESKPRQTKPRSKEETLAFEAGRISALREVLHMLPRMNVDAWEKYKFEPGQMKRFIRLEIEDYESRLNKARATYRAQKRIIDKIGQLQIP